jgi:hypothetical protein
LNTEITPFSTFGQPASGELGNLGRNGAGEPNYWNADLAISRLITIRGSQRVELRLESFNLTNQFNRGDPVAKFQRRYLRPNYDASRRLAYHSVRHQV